MKKICHQSAAVIVMLSVFFPFIAIAQENNWTLKKNRKGIQVFTRDIPGSGFKEFRAIAEIETTMAGVLRLMEDIRSYPQWFPKLQESRLLKQNSSTEMILYHWMKVPFPADDRDSVFKVTARRDAGTRTVTLALTSLPDYLPERKGIIRVRYISGSWTFIPNKERGTVTVIYQMHSDPGGKLTPLLANAAVVKRPFTVLKNMREMLKKPEYRDAKESDLLLFR